MDYLSGISNTDAAAALGALDIRMNPNRRLHKTVGEFEQVTFFFEQRSPCGLYDTEQMVKVWDDREWQRDYPKHPLTYLRVFFRVRNRLRDHFQKGVPLAAVWRDGRMELITVRGGMKPRTEPWPAMPPGQLVKVACESLAAALLACHVPLFTKQPWVHTGSGPVFQFHPVSVCGQFQAAALALAWEQEDWYETHREHPFGYVSCGYRNREFLQVLIDTAVPTVAMKTGKGLPATLPMDADDELQRKFFQRMKKHR